MIENAESYITISKDNKLKIFFMILFTAVTVLLLYIYRYYFWPFLFSFIIYIALRPLHDLISKFKKKRSLSSLVIVLSLILLVLMPLFTVLISLADQTYELYIYIQQQYQAGYLNDFVNNNKIINTVFSYFNIGKGEILKETVDFFRNTSLMIFSNLTAILTFSIKLILNIFFMLLILFFLFKDGNRMDKSFYSILPFPDDIEKKVIDRLKDVIKILFVGNIMIMIAQGLVVGITFSIFDIRMPLLWGTVAGILSLIPAIGTPLVWGPVVLYMIYAGSYGSAIVCGLLCLLGYLILENLIKPLVFGEKLNFHPLIFFFLLIGSIQAFNLPGIIIGPILLTLFYSFWEINKLLNESRNEIQE